MSSTPEILEFSLDLLHMPPEYEDWQCLGYYLPVIIYSSISLYSLFALEFVAMQEYMGYS